MPPCKGQEQESGVWVTVTYVNKVNSSVLCAGWRYGVSVTLSGMIATGQVKVALYGNEGNTRQYDIFRYFLFWCHIFKPCA